MKKTSRLTLALLVSITSFACNNIIPGLNPENNTTKKLSLTELKEKNLGIVKLNIKNNLFKQGFNTKGADFTNTLIKKLKIEVKGLGITTPISSTIDWTPGQTASFSLNVLAGKNRILVISALDANGNILGNLMGTLNVVAGQNNTGTVSYFETVVAETILNVLNSSNSNLLETLNPDTLRTFILNITGYDSVKNTFTKISPSLVNTMLISNNIINNNGALPAENAANLQASGIVKVNINVIGAKLLLNDLNSTVVDSTTASSTTINNVSPGEWFLTIMKDGFTTQSIKVNVTDSPTPLDVNITLVANGVSATPTPTSTSTTTPTPSPTGTAAPDGTILGCEIRTGTTTEITNANNIYKSSETKINQVQINPFYVGDRYVYERQYSNNQKLNYENTYNSNGDTIGNKSFDYNTGEQLAKTDYERESINNRETKVIYSDLKIPANSYVETTVYTDTKGITTRVMADGTSFKSREITYDPTIFATAETSSKYFDKDGKLTFVNTSKWVKIIINENNTYYNQSENGYEGYDSNGNLSYSGGTVNEFNSNGRTAKATNTNTNINSSNGTTTTSVTVNTYNYTSDNEYTITSTSDNRTYKSSEQLISGNKIVNKYYYDNGNLSFLSERENVNNYRPLKDENYDFNTGLLTRKTEYVYSATCP